MTQMHVRTSSLERYTRRQTGSHPLRPIVHPSSSYQPNPFHTQPTSQAIYHHRSPLRLTCKSTKPSHLQISAAVAVANPDYHWHASLVSSGKNIKKEVNLEKLLFPERWKGRYFPSQFPSFYFHNSFSFSLSTFILTLFSCFVVRGQACKMLLALGRVEETYKGSKDDDNSP